jgi:hypothetical protein
MIVRHVALENEWNRIEVLQNAQKLILGSFNPYNPNGDNADYYYGRSTNYFWKAIAEINNLNPNIFFNNLNLKLEYMNDYKFCFFDIINSVEITSRDNNELVLNRFIYQKIHTEFSDKVLFTTRTSFENNQITLVRRYNRSILTLLQEGRISKIIHTMGNNTIGSNLITSPKENTLGDNGFQGLVNAIIGNQNSTFVPQSFSPSGRAIKTGGLTYYNGLKAWLNEHIINQ